jgi:anti-sigma factor RsiW
MFDRCRRWRHLLNRRADERISPSEQHKLDAHLARCESCRKCAEAYDSLRHVMGVHTGLLDPTRAKALDDRIVAAMTQLPSLATQNAGFRGSRRWGNRLPFPFLGQLMAGGLVAASLTVISLFGTLHPSQPPVPDAPVEVVTQQGEPPIPLEALLESPSPRAALLWRTAPNRGKPGTPRKPEPTKLPPLRVNPNGKPKGASLDLSSYVS